MEVSPMIVLGVLLILVAVGAGGFAVIASTTTTQMIELTALGVKVSVSPLALFVAGALSVVLLGLGLAMTSRGMRRTVSSRRELRQLRREQATAGAGASASASTNTNERSHRPERTKEDNKDTSTDTSTGAESQR